MEVPENSEDYWKLFNQKRDEYSMRIKKIDKGADASVFDELRSRIIEFEVFATESTRMLPPYDVRRSSEEIDGLNRALRVAKSRHNPKKKFSFTCLSRVANSAAPAIPTDTSLSTAHGPSSSSSGALVADSFVYRQLKSEFIHLDAETLRSKGNAAQILISDCHDCTVVTTSVAGSIRLESLSHCTLYLGPCSTSVYLEGCEATVVFVACHQLRIHKCKGCSLYVLVGSHPIIEDCSDMGFAPYTAIYPNLQRDIEVAGLRDARCWENVVDFRWHKAGASPNWHLISEADRLTSPSASVAECGWQLSSSSVARQAASSISSTSAASSPDQGVVHPAADSSKANEPSAGDGGDDDDDEL